MDELFRSVRAEIEETHREDNAIASPVIEGAEVDPSLLDEATVHRNLPGRRRCIRPWASRALLLPDEVTQSSAIGSDGVDLDHPRIEDQVS